MRKKLLVLFLCSLLGTSAAAQPKPLIESWLEYATEHWQLVTVVGSTALAIGFGLGLAAKRAPQQKQKPLPKDHPQKPKHSAPNEVREKGKPGNDDIGTIGEEDVAIDAIVAGTLLTGTLAAPNVNPEILQAEIQRLQERVAEFERRDAELERLRKEREAAANAPQTPLASEYQAARTKLQRRDSTAKPLTRPPAVERMTVDYSKSRGSLRKIGADENGEVARPEVAPTPLAEHQQGQFVAAAELTISDRLAQLAAALNQNFGHTDHAVARADLIQFLRRLKPDEARELVKSPQFWDKLMFEGSGFFHYLSAEQFLLVKEGFLAVLEIALRGEGLKSGALKLLLTHLRISNGAYVQMFSEGELRELEELVFKRFNTFIAMLSGAAQKHEKEPEELRKKLAMLKEIVDAFLRAQNERIRQSLQGSLGQFEIVVRGIETGFQLEDNRIIRKLAELVKALKAQGAESEKAREEILEILSKCSPFMLGELAKSKLFATKGLLDDRDFWALLSDEQKEALKPPKME